jgi:hypothetical protein
MKTHLRLIFMAFIAMVIPLVVHAQEDVTSTYLVNPSFEDGDVFFHDSSKVVVGWNVSKTDLLASYHNDDADATKDGTYIFGIWGGNVIGDFQISQTVKNLPAGTYVISCLMTVPENNNTTQRLFASTPSVGCKSLYFASSSLDTVAGEDYAFAGLAVDGTGTGPFKELSVKIKVAQGDSLVLGVRTNGILSKICPFSAIDSYKGWFKIDNFKLSFVSDEAAFSKAQIQKSIDAIKTVSKDSVPGGYTNLIDAKITEAENMIATQNNVDSLNKYNNGLSDFIKLLSSARTTFDKLMNLMFKAEELINTTNLSGKDELQNVYDDTYEVYFSYESLIPDFEKAYTALDAAIHKYADGRITENLALLSSVTVTTSYVSSWESLLAVNDGFDPISSTDRTHPIYGNWRGESYYGETNWVQYEWPYAHSIKEISVYWFSDGGGLAQPTSTKVEYWENNAWVSAGSVDTLLNQFNTLKVDFKTEKVRLSMSSGTETGISEFKVIGLRTTNYTADDYKNLIKSELTTLGTVNLDSVPGGYISLTNAIKQKGNALVAGNSSVDSLSAFFNEIRDYHSLLDSAGILYVELAGQLKTAKNWLETTSYTNKSYLQKVYNTSLSVFTSTKSLNPEFNSAIISLKEAIHAYTAGNIEINIAPLASVTTSNVSSWESLLAVNDGFDPTSSADRTHLIYGNWRGESAYGETDWVQYDWTESHKITDLSVYWFTDGGGVMLPTQAYAEYWDGSAWIKAGDVGAVGEQYNDLKVDLNTTKLKLTMTSTAATGIIEFKVVGYETPVGIVAPSKQSELVNVYPTILRNGETLNLNFSNELTKPVSLEMFTISGQKIYQTSVSGKSTSVTMSDKLSSGIYLMVIDLPEGKLMKKIVIK